jgi:hypothetical protein
MILGKLKKMTLTGYKDEEFTKPIGEPYEATVNPETYSLEYEMRANEENAPGKTGHNLNFNLIAPEKLEFDFLFDGTGALVSEIVPIPLSITKRKNVAEQLVEFKRTIFDFMGETHQIPYVKLEWGTLHFKGRVEKIQITYKLFNPDGTPLRAVAKVFFKGVVSERLEAAIADVKSPDLTHIRTIRAGDNLPLMCYDIYGDATLYREVVRVNRLINFRKLKVGQQIFFPPIEKSTA